MVATAARNSQSGRLRDQVFRAGARATGPFNMEQTMVADSETAHRSRPVRYFRNPQSCYFVAIWLARARPLPLSRAAHLWRRDLAPFRVNFRGLLLLLSLSLVVQ